MIRVFSARGDRVADRWCVLGVVGLQAHDDWLIASGGELQAQVTRRRRVCPPNAGKLTAVLDDAEEQRVRYIGPARGEVERDCPHGVTPGGGQGVIGRRTAPSAEELAKLLAN